MHFGRLSVIAIAMSAIFVGDGFFATQSAEAGPLMDWLMGRRRRQAYYAPAYNGAYQANPYQQQTAYSPAANCGSCQTTCQQTCQRVVAQYVPYTAYRTVYQQVPVTTYRRTTSTDPCTGCTTTCNRPCVTYQSVARRVPYTSYRTVYRTQTYRVPVTYSTPPPVQAAPACNTCSAAPFPNTFASTNNGLLGGSQLGTVANTNQNLAGQNFGTTFQNSAPVSGFGNAADTPPAIGFGDVNGQAIQGGLGVESNRIEPQVDPGVQDVNDGTELNNANGSKTSVRKTNPPGQWNSEPSVLNPNDRTASSTPVRRNFEYQDVYLASYRTYQVRKQPKHRPEPQREVRKNWQTTTPPRQSNTNSGWQSGGW